jgi:hypothetical protein
MMPAINIIDKMIIIGQFKGILYSGFLSDFSFAFFSANNTRIDARPPATLPIREIILIKSSLFRIIKKKDMIKTGKNARAKAESCLMLKS